MIDLLDGVKRNTKHNLTVVTDYRLLGTFVKTWAEGTGHKFLVILGRAGVMKSSTIRAATDPNNRLMVEGMAYPLALYRDVYLNCANRSTPIILDDVPIDNRNRPILQNLTDNYDTCTIRWNSAKSLKVQIQGEAREIDEDEVDDDCDDDGCKPETIELPPKFDTQSPVCWITNDTSRIESMIGLLDRAFIIEFDPPVSDVLEQCRDFIDPDVWQWAAKHQRLLPNLSVRDLKQAGVNKRIGLPWQRLLRDRYLDPRSKLGAYLQVLDDDSLDTAAAKMEKWQKITGYDRATYYRIQSEYRKVFPTRNMPRGRTQRKALTH